MDPLDDLILTAILRTGDENILLQSENEEIEYKEKFNNSSKEAKAKYAKEIAALHNYKGGYLIYGVNDVTNKIIGLDSFTAPDNANLSNDINNYFSPAISFDSRIFTINAKKLFILYIHPRKSIPTVCTKSFQDVLRESTIYWRYNAISSPIKSGDLIHLLNTLRGEENKKHTEILEKEYRSKYRPKLFINHWISNPREINIYLDNRGPIAHIDKLEIVRKNIDSLIINQLKSPYPLTNENNLMIPIKSFQENLNEAEFELEIRFHDDENYNYRQLISYKSRKASLSSLEEIN